ncbi:LysR substrate binding domain protein [compost metagenome]
MSLGRILHDRLRGLCVVPLLQTLYESDLADALHAMARQGFGLAWLPHTLIEADLRAGALVRADSARNDIHMEIRIYQSVDNAKLLARDVWARIEAYAAR